MTETDIAEAIAALSARTVALEAAVSALADQCGSRDRALLVFDDFGREMFDRYAGLPVNERYLDLLRESFEDLRSIFVSNVANAVLMGSSLHAT